MATQAGKLNDEQAPGFVERLKEYPRRWRTFLHEVRVEMRQVTWPSMLEVRQTTLVIIAAVAFFGLFFAIVDRGAAWVVQEVIKAFKH